MMKRITFISLLLALLLPATAFAHDFEVDGICYNRSAATAIELDNVAAEMFVGEVMQLNATVLPGDATNRVVAWGSSNPAVATVSNEGLVTALTEGTAIITAMTTDGSNLSASCVVTVSSLPVSSITLNKTSATLIENNTTQLIATVLPDNATYKQVSWRSSNSSVATVDNNGLVTAMAPGTASITATTTDGSNLSASCDVTVISKTDFTFHITDKEVFVLSGLSCHLINKWNSLCLRCDHIIVLRSFLKKLCCAGLCQLNITENNKSCDSSCIRNLAKRK